MTQSSEVSRDKMTATQAALSVFDDLISAHGLDGSWHDDIDTIRQALVNAEKVQGLVEANKIALTEIKREYYTSAEIALEDGLAAFNAGRDEGKDE